MKNLINLVAMGLTTVLLMNQAQASKAQSVSLSESDQPDNKTTHNQGAIASVQSSETESLEVNTIQRESVPLPPKSTITDFNPPNPQTLTPPNSQPQTLTPPNPQTLTPPNPPTLLPPPINPRLVSEPITTPRQNPIPNTFSIISNLDSQTEDLELFSVVREGVNQNATPPLPLVPTVVERENLTLNSIQPSSVIPNPTPEVKVEPTTPTPVIPNPTPTPEVKVEPTTPTAVIPNPPPEVKVEPTTPTPVISAVPPNNPQKAPLTPQVIPPIPTPVSELNFQPTPPPKPNPSLEFPTSNVNLLIPGAEVPFVAQSPSSTPPPETTPSDPSIKTPNTNISNLPVEVLNPSANPLLFPTQPQEVQIKKTLSITLKEALQLARKNNTNLQTAVLNIERAQATLAEALAAQYPTLNFQMEISTAESAQSQISNEQRSKLGFDTSDNPTISTSFTSQIEMNYNIFSAGRTKAQIDAALSRIRFNELALERQSEQTRLDVTLAYYDIQDTDAQVEIRAAAVKDAQQSLKDAQSREQAGVGTRFDVLQAEVQLANDQQELIRAQSNQKTAKRRIIALLNLAQDAEVLSADPIEKSGDWKISLEESIILAYKNRAELEQQLLQRNITEQERKIAIATIRPQISLFANYNLLGFIGDSVGVSDGYRAGGRVQWNIFDGGAAQARAKQAEIDGRLAETQFTQNRNDIRVEVEQNFFSLLSNQENIGTAEKGLTQAEESLRLARLRFEAGVGTNTDVINQQTALTRARGNLLTAIINYNRALANLQRAITNLPDSRLIDNKL